MKKIPLIIILLALAGLIYYAFPVVNNRYLINDPKKIKINSESEKSDNQKSNNSISSKNDSSESAPMNIKINPSDCDNECSRFEEDSDEQQYCEQVCGISDLYIYDGGEEKSEDEATDCSGKTGIKKDYCIKDLAIENGDFKTCDEINDANIKKTCQNRITEDLLEEESNQN